MIVVLRRKTAEDYQSSEVPMGKKMVLVATFSSVHEAHLAKANLEAAGIPAFTSDEHLVSAQPLYSNALGGVKVWTPASFAEEARALLSAPEDPEEKKPAEKRPAEGHRNGARKPWVRYLVWLWLFLGIAAILSPLFQLWQR